MQGHLSDDRSTKIFYHGTLTRRGENILKEGLIPEKGLVFLTPDYELAEDWGNFILRIELPEGFPVYLKGRERGFEEYYVKEVIPAKYITKWNKKHLPEKEPWEMTRAEFRSWDFKVPEGGASKSPKTVFSWSKEDYETLYDLSQQDDIFRFEEVLGKGWRDWKPTLHLKNTIKQNKLIRIYRASDKDIVPGSYVSESKEYAVKHGEIILRGEYTLFSMEVKPSELMIYGDPHEFIYIPESVEVGHKRILEKAMAEGKSVPEEVLKEYPELVNVKGHLANFSNPLMSPEIDSLAKEARTYKSAEQFEKKYPNGVIFYGTLYHNTNYDDAHKILKEGFEPEDTSYLPENQRALVSGNLGDGIYLSPDYNENKQMWGGFANLIVKPARPLLLYDLGDEEGSAQIPSLKFSDNLKKKGYEGIIVNDPHPRSGGYQVVVFHPEILKDIKIAEESDIPPEILDKIDVTKQSLQSFWRGIQSKGHLSG